MKIDPNNVCCTISEPWDKTVNYTSREKNKSHIKGSKIRMDFSIINTGKSSKFGKKMISTRILYSTFDPI